VDTGKPPLGDYRRGLWTWPRLYIDLSPGLTDDQIVRGLHAPAGDGMTPLARCIERFRAEVESASALVADLLPHETLVDALLADWLDVARSAVRPAPAPVELPRVAGWESLMEEHAKSFRFASQLFPADRRQQVTGVYAWCRYTDDLVDGVDLPAAELDARLDAWLDLSLRAYQGERTGNALADRVMTEMREADVPFGYAEELIEGMRMDVRGVEYGTVAELRLYTYRVASVVGLWMTELFGIRDPWLLDRAAALGHAMQLTNILRDVGEDLEEGRLYLPAAWLRAMGLSRADLERMAETGRIEPDYAALTERLIRVAESEYDHAFPAIGRLPGWYRRPVAVAADVYRGIHDEIRANGYDNLTKRAHTGLAAKIRLGAGALLRTHLPGGASKPRGRSEPSTGKARATAALGAALLLATIPLAAAPAPAAAQAEPQDRGARQTGGQGNGGEERTSARWAPALAEVPDAAWDRAIRSVGTLWVEAVERESAVATGLEAVASLRSRFDPLSPDRDRLLRAYRGSFLALRAKHGGGPRQRLRDLRGGFELMDAAVAESPESPELRYVRLMSGFYLPAFFGRREEVGNDMEALIRVLPRSRSAFPRALYPEVVEFVLEHGDPADADRRRLKALLP
jgi:phytoene synthase